MISKIKGWPWILRWGHIRPYLGHSGTIYFLGGILLMKPRQKWYSWFWLQDSWTFMNFPDEFFEGWASNGHPFSEKKHVTTRFTNLGWLIVWSPMVRIVCCIHIKNNLVSPIGQPVDSGVDTSSIDSEGDPINFWHACAKIVQVRKIYQNLPGKPAVVIPMSLFLFFSGVMVKERGE